MAHDREVAGIRCTEVLARLSEYVDGELDAPTKQTIDAHLLGCDWCERFGREFSTVVAEVRTVLRAQADVDPGVEERLLAALAQESD